VALAAGGAAHAISAEDIAAGFRNGVRDYCAPAVLEALPLDQWPAARRAGLSVAEPAARTFLHAAETDKVWNVAPGAGAVFIVEKTPGECLVTTYGPPLVPTFKTVGEALIAEPLAMRPVKPPPLPDAMILRLVKLIGTDTAVVVDLIGSEPGMPGHASRFTDMTAFVSRRPVKP
jgi:hypothetical protein